METILMINWCNKNDERKFKSGLIRRNYIERNRRGFEMLIGVYKEVKMIEKRD